MKNLFVLMLLTTALLIGAAGRAQAQTPASPNAPAAQSNAAGAPINAGGAANSIRTLSGCLQQGAGASEYTLFGPDANSWELKSNRVDLSAHVGQAVTVAYVISPNAKVAAGASAPLMVTDLVMVSSSCSW